ncbi:MAG: hypothetical protein J1E96_06820 [Ruminococcus sp.]|nr:hypothetical protein [Ruminococcus sp.]
MKKKMFLITLLSLVGLVVFGATYCFTGNRVIFSLMITFGTIFYHLAIRLAAGYLIDAKFHNQMDYTKGWFREKAFEPKLYKKLKVKKWKNRFPTFNPQDFELQNRSVTEIIQVTCQSEIVHEVNMVLSFVPVIFSVWFGSLEVFVITSFMAFLYDSMFVIMQRFNRPRLMRLLRK